MEMDTILNGDNLEVMAELPGDSADLVYADPPFLTGTAFKDGNGKVQFTDKFKDLDAYMAFMTPRLEEIRRLLKPDGNFFLHCDVRTSFRQRIVCDRIFGEKKFLNEIVWKRNRITGFLKHAKGFGKITDRILVYGDRIDKNAVAGELSEEHIEENYPYTDERGKYQSVSLTCDALKKLGSGSPRYEFMGHVRYWQYSRENMQKLLADDRIIPPKKPGGLPRRKCYAHEVCEYPTDLWDDIGFIEAGSKEKTGYPTQKPEALLERIILCGSPIGGLVLDPFCGSGTTLAVAKKLNRRWLGIDVNPDAAALAGKRTAKYEELVFEDE